MHEAHYCHGKEETIDKIERLLTPEEFKGFCKGNMIKYHDRAPYKGDPIGDEDKMLDYAAYMHRVAKFEEIDGFIRIVEEDDEENCSIVDVTEKIEAEFDGFTYPPLGEMPTISEQYAKVLEEIGEMRESVIRFACNGMIDPNSFRTRSELYSFLAESEDVIHAIEEMQRILIKDHLKKDPDEFKPVLQASTYVKNELRGYYD